MRPSRFTVDPHILDNSDLSKVEVLRHWQHQISVLLEQLQRASFPDLPDPPSSSVYLDGQGHWSAPPTGTGGGGDMFKATYDTNNNGVVDTCDSLAWAKLTGVPASFTPSAHAPTHKSGGGDSIKLDEFAAPTDVTTLNASTSAHGLLPKLPGTTTTFLRGDGAFTTPTGIVPSAHASTHITGGSDVIPAPTTSASGLVPILPGNTTQFLRADGTFATPSVGAPPASLTDLGSPAGNSTINTAQAFLIAVNLAWTTAANWTLTLQNVVLGSEFHLRFLNSSGATRTFTISATNPSAASYTIAVYVPGSGALTGALSIANGAAINLRGVSYTVGGNPTIQLFGFGSTG